MKVWKAELLDTPLFRIWTKKPPFKTSQKEIKWLEPKGVAAALGRALAVNRKSRRSW